jgi:NitT/TauT family transport system substrate-binding protein
MTKLLAAALAALVTAFAAVAHAESLKVAISQRGFWDSSFVEFAEAAGFFKKRARGRAVLHRRRRRDLDHGAVGQRRCRAVERPARRDRRLREGRAGAGDLGADDRGRRALWYVRAESGMKSLKDAAGKTIAFSSPGSSSNLILLALLRQAQVDAKPLAAGGAPATLTQVMTGQIDVGWAAAPFGLQNILDGKITVIARTATCRSSPTRPSASTSPTPSR